MKNWDYFIESNVVEIYDHVLLGRRDATEIRKFMKREPSSKANSNICIQGLEIFDTGNYKIGRGVRTVKFIKAGTVVLTFCGALTTQEPIDRTYVVKYKEGLWIDAKKFSNISRWVNHKCGVGNLKLVKTSSLRFPTVYLVATRDILPEEELNYNYGYKMPGCQCDVCLSKNPFKTLGFSSDETGSHESNADAGGQSSPLPTNTSVSNRQSSGTLKTEPRLPEPNRVPNPGFKRPTFSPPRKSTRFQSIVTSALSSMTTPKKILPKTKNARVAVKPKKDILVQLRTSTRRRQPSPSPVLHPVPNKHEVQVPPDIDGDGPNYVVKYVKMSYYDYFKRTYKQNVQLRGKFRCELCPMRTSDKCEMTRHMKKIHGKTTKVFVCNVDGCSTEFPDVSNVNRHVRNVHNRTVKERKPGNKFHCDRCEKTFATMFALQRHYINRKKKKQVKRVCIA